MLRKRYLRGHDARTKQTLAELHLHCLYFLKDVFGGLFSQLSTSLKSKLYRRSFRAKRVSVGRKQVGRIIHYTTPIWHQLPQTGVTINKYAKTRQEHIKARSPSPYFNRIISYQCID